MLALAILLGDKARVFAPSDGDRVKILLALAAVQLIPLARIGLVPVFLDKNRHR